MSQFFTNSYTPRAHSRRRVCHKGRDSCTNNTEHYLGSSLTFLLPQHNMVRRSSCEGRWGCDLVVGQSTRLVLSSCFSLRPATQHVRKSMSRPYTLPPLKGDSEAPIVRPSLRVGTRPKRRRPTDAGSEQPPAPALCESLTKFRSAKF